MPSVKKKPAHMESAVIAHIAAKVEADPRGAPTTLVEEMALAAEVKAALPPCRLDEMPLNSKLVILNLNDKKTPQLVTPNGYVTLAPDDVAHSLPMGAKVFRKGQAAFFSEQLDAVESRPMLVTATAREAIAAFTAHFHG